MQTSERPSHDLLPPWLAAISGALVLGVIASSISSRPTIGAAPRNKKLDPAAWGSDHVGAEVPQFMESGECLFCHRLPVGNTWAANKHNRTIRDAEPQDPAMLALRADAAAKPLAEEVQLVMGDTRAQRFLKRSQAYGKLDLLSATAAFGRGRRPKIEPADKPHWDTESFALQCAGCHTTAVDPESHAFAAVSLDCFTCHGDSTAEHANDTKLIALSKARKDSPAAVTSICGSCHIRFGKSKSSGLPYPTNFVAGDNLFKDFQVDFNVADDEKLNPADRHVMENVRDVVVYWSETTCLSCHEIHTGSTKKHHELPVVASCMLCHENRRPIKGHKTYEVHSERCKY